MSAAWRQAALLLAGAVVLLGTGILVTAAGLRASGVPRRLLAAEGVLRQLGGERGLAARRQLLSGVAARLAAARRARAADAGALSRRIEEVCADLGLQLTAASAWAPVPKVKVAGGAAFTRTLHGRGPFAALLAALATLESWPDELRVRRLSVAGQGTGDVAFSLDLAVVRSAAGGPAKKGGD